MKLKDPRIDEQIKKQIQAYIDRENLADEDIKRIQDTLEIVLKIKKGSGVANPLEAQYFSAAPFLFGPNLVMKFSANPQAIAAASEIPDNPSENYLREAVSHTMNNDQDTIFDFMVQVRSDKGDLEVENASALWNEEDFPFIKVATITIAAPQQEISQPRNLEHCENQAFTPWHSLTAHQPIGSINRLRKTGIPGIGRSPPC